MLIPIRTGDPKAGPASYTRFVLPFAYCLETYQGGSPFRVYTPSEDVSRWQRRYFTVETATVLYERSKSFEIDDRTGVQTFHIQRAERTIPVHIAPPRLRLFEWPSAIAAANQGTLRDPLRLGFLSVDVFFPDRNVPVSLDDFLALNEMFRYWQQPYDGHEQDYRAFLGNCPIDLCPRVRQVRDADLHEIYFERWASLLKWPIKCNGKHWALFPQAWHQQAKHWIRGDGKPQDNGWITYADSRTFVWTCAILEHGGSTLKAHLPHACDKLKLWQYGHWIKLLNADSPGKDTAETHQSTCFEREWVEPRTYKRWMHYGTLYGFNYHSGAMLGPALDKPGPPLWQHFGDMYFDQALLLLYLRIASFNFSHQLNRISAQARDDSQQGKDGHDQW